MTDAIVTEELHVGQITFRRGGQLGPLLRSGSLGTRKRRTVFPQASRILRLLCSPGCDWVTGFKRWYGAE